MTKLILTDIDETVLQYAAPFTAWCLAEGLAPRGCLRDSYSVEDFLGCTRDEAVAHMERFRDTGQLDDLPAEPDASRVLAGLYAAGWRFVGITACGTSLGVQRARKALLERTFGFPWEALHMVDLGASKDQILNAYGATVWVEDNLHHAIRGADLGHRSFLLDRPHNRHTDQPGVTRVRDWDEIALTLHREG